MRDQHGLRRRSNSMRSGSIPAVTEIDSHADFIHFLHRRDARFAQSRIPGFKAAIAKNAAIVIGKLHDAHAEIPENLDALRTFFKKSRVLKTGQDADLLLPLRARDL